MVRYKMLGRDTNASPIQYRTWVVDDTPDLNAELYTGLKSGDSPLIDISAYLIEDGYAVADFNLPDPLTWKTTYQVLPESLYHSSLAVVDGYVYLFGGCLTDKILRAPTNNPATWEDTGATLPTPLYGSHLAVVDGYIYLFGGNNGSPTNHIYSASVEDPLTWTDLGALLPKRLCFAQLAIIDHFIYLFGGKSGNAATDSILKASTSTPTVWSDTGSTLLQKVYGSQLAIVDGYAYMYGGLIGPSNPIDSIVAAPIDNPTFWFSAGNMTYKSYNSQIAVVADTIYLFGPTIKNNAPTSQTRIMVAEKANPVAMIDSLKVIPGEASCSQLGIIYDRLFLFGGNGSTVIFAADNILKYKIDDPVAVTYGEVTRTEVEATPEIDRFTVLGMPPWKTDYGT